MTASKVTLQRQLEGTPRSDIKVPSGQTTSNSFVTAQATAGSFQTPAALSSTTYGFEVSSDGVTWVPLRDATTGSALSRPCAASGGYALPFELFLHRMARYVFGTSEGAERTIITTLQN